MTHAYNSAVDDSGSQTLEGRIRELGIDDDGQVEAVRKLIQSVSDKRVQTGVDRFRAETLPIHVQKELDAITSKKPEEVLRTKERALELASKIGMDYKVVSQLLLAEGDVEERAMALEESVHDAQISYVNERLKLGGVNPPQGQNIVWDGSLSRADLKRMSPEQISKAMAGGRLDSMLRGGK